MIARKNSNTPTWYHVTTYSDLPEELRKLEHIAYNLRFEWQPNVSSLFERIDADLWDDVAHNPVLFLRKLSRERIDAVMEDKILIDRIEQAHESLMDYLNEPVDTSRPSVAYFSMEYGLSNILHIYSGGLGVLAGDYLKEASDSNVPMVAVGLLYRQGYFSQTIDENGRQIASNQKENFYNLPLVKVSAEGGEPLVIPVLMGQNTVYAHVWKVAVGRISLYLLDTDIDLNGEWDRSITAQLYGGDWENRLRQEILLGIGGIKLLRALHIESDVYHMNEGHAAFINIERLAHMVEGGLSFDQALEIVRSSSLYTVHTPVPAGHDYFDEELLSRYMSDYARRMGIEWTDFLDLGKETSGEAGKFSMSHLALNTCIGANGVSRLHGEVSREMFAPMWKGFFPEELHVGHVTNGVHLPTWATEEWYQFFEEHLGKDFLKHQSEETCWGKLETVPNDEIWTLRMQLKQRLYDYIENNPTATQLFNGTDPSFAMKALDQFSPNAMYIGFARRFATYKRAHLLFTDLERLASIMNNPLRPVHFIFAGKAHPADGAGQGLIQHIVEISKRPEFLGKIIFLQDYDLTLAKILIPGVDVWLNTPVRPMEASGTSGMKAQMNGCLNASILDGWWAEGYRKSGGWAINEHPYFSSLEYGPEVRDKLDAAVLYELLEKEIVPMYYIRNEKGCPTEWVNSIKYSMRTISPHFTMRRMIDEYYAKYYEPLAHRTKELVKDNLALTNTLVQWKHHVSDTWSTIECLNLDIAGLGQGNDGRPTGKNIFSKVVLNCGAFNADLITELVVSEISPLTGKLSLVKVYPFREVAREGNIRTYELELTPRNPGRFSIAIRISPWHPALPNRQDFAYVHWLSIDKK